MGKPKVKKQSSHEKWRNAFNALSKKIRTQCSQLETLADKRKQLEDRINLLYDRWVSDVRLFEDQVSQMKREVALNKKVSLLDAAKTDLVVGMKQREAFLYKLKLEQAEGELGDFITWFDILCHRCPSEQNISSSNLLPDVIQMKDRLDTSSTNVDSEEAEQHCKTMESELASLKQEFNKLAVKNSSEVSALQAEKTFAWNQYREMESKYTDQLRLKDEEMKQTNEKVMKLLDSVEQLESSNRDKDDKIASLEADRTKLESENNKKSGEISRLSKELELLRNRKSNGAFSAQGLQCGTTEHKASTSERRKKIGPKGAANQRSKMVLETSTPEGQNNRGIKGSMSSSLLRRCAAPSAASNSESNKRTRSTRSGVPVNKDSSSQTNNDQGSGRKRRKVGVVTMQETPSLFNSSFKIPKLKSPAVPAS